MLGGAVIFIFFIRFLFFLSLWVGLVLSPEHLELKRLSFLLLLCTGAIILHFIIPIFKKKEVLFTLIFTLVFLTNFFIEVKGMYFILLLLLYIMVEAALYVRARSFYYLSIVAVFFAISSLYIHDRLSIVFVFSVMLMYFLLQLLWKKIGDREDLLAIYNEVLLEYRLLKRRALENEGHVRLEERTRISREIHDSVGHKLTAVLMQLEIMSIESNDLRIGTVKKEVRDSLEEIRLAVRTLKHDEAAGLSSVLQLIRKLEVESHLSINLTTKHGVLSIKLTNDQSIVLYRVLQEAFTNAMKYATSREVFVVLGRTAVGHFHLNVQNRINGAKSSHHGFGLENMQQRLEEIGGTVNAYQTEKYFIVEASFPLKEDR